MTHASAAHREFDRRFADALACDGEPGPAAALVRSRHRLRDARTMNAPRKPRVLLLEVEVRTSGRTGRPWYAAWLGKARLVGFEAEEANERGHRVIRFYAEEPKSHDGSPVPRRPVVEREATSAHHSAPPPAGTRPGGFGRATERPDPHGP